MFYTSIDPDDHIWHMHFDGACSNEGKGVGIVLYSPLGKFIIFLIDSICLYQ
jgi:hypothetical protein